jgi:NADH dehydrogenase/NADH:ubiquinone oxidoreductase subunit G
MIKEFEKLTASEQDVLLKAPAIVSLLAASATGQINEWEKTDAIKLAHLKTYSANPLLIPYYKEAEKVFERNFEAMAKKYAPFDEPKRAMMQDEIEDVNDVIAKLDDAFAIALHTSLAGYAEHVKKAYKGLVVNFLFPFPIPGLTE